MNFVKTILWLVVSVLFWILITFWVSFVFISIYYLVESGPDLVIHWYMHISGVGLQYNWNWKVFLARLVANLAITVALYFLRGRLRAGSQTISPDSGNR